MTRQSDIYKRLKLHVRRIVREDGQIVLDSNVCCPNGDVMVPVDRCATCGECDGFIEDDPAAPFIICRKVPRHPEEPLRPTSESELSVRASAGRVADLMTRDVVCMRPELDLEVAAEVFASCGLNGVPIVDDSGRPIGVLSKSDLLRELGPSACTGDLEEGPADEDCEPEARRATRGTIAHAMAPVAMTLPESASIGHAAAVMAQARIHRLPVIDDGGHIVGIVSALDVLRWLASESGYEVPRTAKRGLVD
jgi:CBS domain-containing protein